MIKLLSNILSNKFLIGSIFYFIIDYYIKDPVKSLLLTASFIIVVTSSGTFCMIEPFQSKYHNRNKYYIKPSIYNHIIL